MLKFSGGLDHGVGKTVAFIVPGFLERRCVVGERWKGFQLAQRRNGQKLSSRSCQVSCTKSVPIVPSKTSFLPFSFNTPKPLKPDCAPLPVRFKYDWF